VVSTWQKADGQRLAGPEPAGVQVAESASQSCEGASSEKMMWYYWDTINIPVLY